MRVVHAYNRQRGLGGADKATAATVQALRDHGVEVEEFVRDSRELPGGLAGKARALVDGVYSAGAVRDFETLLAARRPDLVHVHELYPLISPWILPACRRAGVPVVMTVNDFRMSCPIATHHTRGEACHKCAGGREHWCVIRNCRGSVPESMAYALRNATADRFGLFRRNVDRFIAISDFQRDYLERRLGLPAERVALNHCLIAIPEAPVADPSEGRYVGFAGRFAPEKGAHVMIEACRKLGLPMRLAGDAPQHPLAKPGEAEFVMTRSPEELAAFYRGARVIVVPSTWTETFGIVAAEAMSHGVPVVASRLGALPGTVRDGETGLLATAGDVDDFAAKIGRIWHDPALARRLGRGAAAHVATNYGPGPHVERTLRVYRELCPGAA